MNERYVIAVKHKKTGIWVYLGYHEKKMNGQCPALVTAPRAKEFFNIEDAKSWYNDAKQHVNKFINSFCDPSTLCIQKRICHYDHKIIEVL